MSPPPLLFARLARLDAGREERTESAAHGDRGKRLAIALERQHRRRNAAGDQDEGAESKIAVIEFHIRNGGLDDRQGAF